MKTALERHDFDCTQMALNAGMANMINGGGKRGMVPNPAMQTSFESLALPVALRKKMGVLAIKAFAQDALIGQAAPEKLLHYTLSLPIAAVVGMPKLEHIEQNVATAKAGAATRAGDEEDVRRPFGEEQDRPGCLLPRPRGRVNRSGVAIETFDPSDSDLMGLHAPPVTANALIARDSGLTRSIARTRPGIPSCLNFRIPRIEIIYWHTLRGKTKLNLIATWKPAR